MSQIAVPISYPFYDIFNVGVSKESEEVDHGVDDVFRDNSTTLGWRYELREEAMDIFCRCSDKDWDGYDAYPITKEALDQALMFIEALPENIIIPDIAPEPSGSLSFEWNLGKDNLFSVTLESGKIVYACIYGSNKDYGEKLFVNKIPGNILNIIFDRYSKD